MVGRALPRPCEREHQVDTVVDGRRRDDARGQRIGVEFLIRTMDNLESDLREARVRANAWATGDIEALKKQAIADQATQYLYASSWPYLQDSELAALQAEADRRWVTLPVGAREKQHLVRSAADLDVAAT